jgi:GTP pyrophosphokinase
MSYAEFTREDYDKIERGFALLKEAAARRCRGPREIAVVEKAFEFANDAHRNVRRRSGDPYILHPIEVALIVVNDIGLGYKSISAALLHDVVEDTDYTVKDIRKRFGDKIGSLVDGLTKIKTMLDNEEKDHQDAVYNRSLQAENFKRILLTLNDDVRVVLIKLADRLHNCRTIEFMPEYKRDKILSETMFIFIPLAHRLGLYKIKSEMENIWLRYKEPEAYGYIKQRIDEEVSGKRGEIEEFIAPIDEVLRKEGMEYEIRRRIKTPYSVWMKMQKKNIPFEEVYDLIAIRIVFTPPAGSSKEQERERCFDIFEKLTGLYASVEGRYRDWIRQPKPNGYEALHTTLIGKKGLKVEVQIRTRRMDDIAEKGIAAHWAYKRSGYLSENDSEMDRWLEKVQDILVNPDVNALELLDIIHNDLTSTQITVFTPKGDQRLIEKGATALDFAYLIHTEIGDRALAAKINMRLVPLSTVLKTGDRVEIITAEEGAPKAEWLDFLKTRKARSQVSDYIRRNSAARPHHRGGNVRYVTADCCKPIPGDPVIGFREEDGSVTIHKKSCPVAEELASKFSDRIVSPRWSAKMRHTDTSFPVRITLQGIDRLGLLGEITQHISYAMGVNMRRLSLASEEGIFRGFIDMEVKDKKILETIIGKLEGIEGIQRVVRSDMQ